MSQIPTRPCSRCNMRLPLSQRFCSNCGARQDIDAPDVPGAMAANDFPPGPGAGQTSNPSSYQQDMQPFPPSGGYQQGYQQPYRQVPSYAQTTQNANGNTVGIMGAILGLLLLRGVRRGVGGWLAGCFIWLFILLAFGLCGSFAYLTSTARHTGSTTSSSALPYTSRSTPTVTIQKVTSSINAAVLYSGVNITIIDAQQAPSFADDANNQETGLLRLNLKEQTGAISGVYVNYTSNFQLVGPDGTTINAVAVQHDTVPEQSVSRTNWIDFPISKNVQTDQYTLRIGAVSEAQMDVPLTGKADLSKYKPRKVSPNATVTYGGVNLVITSATATLSSDGPQANKGMMYVVVNITINNTSSHTFYGGLTNVRLKSGATSSPPARSLDTVAPGQTNVQNTLTFTMPQGTTDFSLVFLPSTDNNAPTQATANFQIP